MSIQIIISEVGMSNTACALCGHHKCVKEYKSKKTSIIICETCERIIGMNYAKAVIKNCSQPDVSNDPKEMITRELKRYL